VADLLLTQADRESGAEFPTACDIVSSHFWNSVLRGGCQENVLKWRKIVPVLNMQQELAGWRWSKALDLYSGGSRFELPPGRRVFRLQIFVVFRSLSMQMPG
jgi:hypothetical protein